LPRGSRWLLTNHPASFAGLQVLLTALVGGAELVASDHGSLGELFAAAQRHHPTHVSGTPTFWRTFLLTLSGSLSDIPLKQITIGGEAVDQDLLDRLRAAFPDARIIQIYASTEAGALFAVNDGRAGFPARWLQDGVEDVRFRIRDGVLQTISPRAMLGYVQGRASALSDDGWLGTGDLVEVQGDRVVFRGRSDTVINVGGATVAPEEVERTLMELPFVRDVKVFGKPNPIVGALVHAYVVIGRDVSEQDARSGILLHSKERLEAHKVPRVLHFVAALPMNASGKKIASDAST
jgi:acyl-coenzyme A synthetase/AMP-(fatty) acid ligase